MLGQIVFFGILTATVKTHWDVPKVKPSAAPAHSFSANRTLPALQDLVDCGFKVVGTSMNEVCATNKVVGELEAIRATAEDRVELDVQRASGSFFMPFLEGFTNTYTNVTNVVVRLRGAPQATEGGDSSSPPGRRHRPADAHLIGLEKSICEPPYALLVSAHYDSAFGSPAASDDLVEIVTMLEVLRNSLASDALPVDLIFNFNGGEETIMMASHGFITQHRWARHICAFINLEAAGSGGREAILQVGPRNGWLAEAYGRAAPKPHGSAVIQAVFSTGLIPGDTDYRIYRDYGGLGGFDFAVTTNGYVYHTSKDNMANIKPGSIQRYGDNILALVREVAKDIPRAATDSDFRAKPTPCFFDVLGRFFVTYPQSMAQVLHSLAMAFALQVAFSVGISRAVRRAAYLFFIWMCSVVVAVLPAVALWYQGVHNPFYKWEPFMIVGLIILPCGGVTMFWGQPTESPEDEAVEAAGAALLWLPLLGLAQTFAPQAAYLPFACLVFPLIPQRVPAPNETLAAVSKVLGRAVAWILLVPLIVLGVDFVVPLMGRAGANTPTGIAIALFTSAQVGLLLVTLSPVKRPINVSPKARRVLAGCVALCVVVIMLQARERPAFGLGFPKRLFAQHVERGFFTSACEAAAKQEVRREPDNAVWLFSMDPTKFEALRPALPPLHNESWTWSPGQGVYGEAPLIFPVMSFASAEVVPVEEPIPAGRVALQLLDVQELSGSALQGRNLSFRITGPHIMVLALSDTVRAWSFGEQVPKARKECDCHYVLHAHGMAPGGFPISAPRVWEFWLIAAPGRLELEVGGHDLEAGLESPGFELVLGAKAEQPPWLEATRWSTGWQSHHFHC